MSTNKSIALPSVALGLLGLAAGFAIFKAFTSKPRSQQKRVLPVSDGREFAVMYSAFDAPFKHLGTNPEQPEAPYKTLAEARDVAERWELTAGAINGRAQVVNVRTGEVVAPVLKTA